MKVLLPIALPIILQRFIHLQRTYGKSLIYQKWTGYMFALFCFCNSNVVNLTVLKTSSAYALHCRFSKDYSNWANIKFKRQLMFTVFFYRETFPMLDLLFVFHSIVSSILFLTNLLALKHMAYLTFYRSQILSRKLF